MTTEVLLSRYDVNVSHTRHVANLSLEIFDRLRKPYDLPEKARHLMERGALLHDVGLSTDVSQHHIVGRDIVLSANFPDLDADQRAIIACLVAFHRKKVRPETEPTYLRLGKKNRRTALCLASFLRVADGLDYSHTQTTIIQDCVAKGDDVLIRVNGPCSNEDSARAIKKSDLWCKVFGCNLSVIPIIGNDRTQQNTAESTNESAETQHTQSNTMQTEPSVVVHHKHNGTAPDVVTKEEIVEAAKEKLFYVDDSLAEIGRRMLRQNFQKLLRLEKDARQDKDIEAVHDMRVCTRRLRAILPMLEEVAPRKAPQRYRKRLRSIAQSLAGVRDGDVFLKQINDYVAQLPKDERKNLEPLTTAISHERAVARTHMLMQLESTQYTNFKRDFSAFMTDNAEDWNTKLRIKDVVGSMVWKCYEELRSYETRIDMDNLHEADVEELHNMRIEGKRMRYVLEFLSERYETAVQPLLKPLMALQECLGSLQDITVARSFIATIKTNAAQGAALNTYLASRHEEQMQLLIDLPSRWQKITKPSYQQKLMGLIIGL